VGGAFCVEFLLEYLRAFGIWRLEIFGLLLLLTMRFARNGLLTPLWLQFMRLGEVRTAHRMLRDVTHEAGQEGANG
jgi:hypothetical protein